MPISKGVPPTKVANLNLFQGPSLGSFFLQKCRTLREYPFITNKPFGILLMERYNCQIIPTIRSKRNVTSKPDLSNDTLETSLSSVAAIANVLALIAINK